MQDAGKKRFVVAVILAWAPCVAILIGLGYAFRGILNSKATGFAAVAGGFAESLVLWGLISLITSQTVAIAWLSRSFSRDHWARNIVSALSIGLSGLMLLIVGGSLWFLLSHARHS